MKSDRLARCAVLTALALALSVVEQLLPLTLLIPLPGLRLGLANLVTVFALCRLSGRETLLILITRCVLGAVGGGNLTALAFSLTGGLLALAAMAVLISRAPLVYLPALLAASVVTGGVTGLVSMLLVHRVPEKVTGISLNFKNL